MGPASDDSRQNAEFDWHWDCVSSRHPLSVAASFPTQRNTVEGTAEPWPEHACVGSDVLLPVGAAVVVVAAAVVVGF